MVLEQMPELDLVVVTLSTEYGTGYMHSRSFGVFEDVLSTVELE